MSTHASAPTPRIEVFTDGACSGNPGPGGWAALLRSGAHEKWLTGAELNTTNNRMELIAAIRALQALKQRSAVCITTDSRYVQQGASEWLPGWKARGWRNAAKEPVANQDLWKEMDAALAQHDVELKWVRGHIGHVENEACDARARAAITRLLSAHKQE